MFLCVPFFQSVCVRLLSFRQTTKLQISKFDENFGENSVDLFLKRVWFNFAEILLNYLFEYLIVLFFPFKKLNNKSYKPFRCEGVPFSADGSSRLPSLIYKHQTNFLFFIFRFIPFGCINFSRLAFRIKVINLNRNLKITKTYIKNRSSRSYHVDNYVFYHRKNINVRIYKEQCPPYPVTFHPYSNFSITLPPPP